MSGKPYKVICGTCGNAVVECPSCGTGMYVDRDWKYYIGDGNTMAHELRTKCNDCGCIGKFEWEEEE